MYACGICRELISDSSESEMAQSGAGARVLLATKCGHLFHNDCLKRVFENKDGGVWTKKDCPTCKMSLTVATDLLRIFPTTFFKPGPSKKDLLEKIEKYESDILLLGNRLESSFLNLRHAEKVNAGLLMEIEKQTKIMQSRIVYISREYEKRIQTLANEKETLNSTLQKIHQNIIQVGNGSVPLAPPGFDAIFSQRGATKSEGPVGRDKQITGILSNNRDDTRSDYLNSITENNLNILDNSRSQNGKQTMDNDTIDPAVDEFLNELHMDKAVTSTKNASVSSNALNRANQYARSAKDPTNNKEPLYGKYYCDQCTATWGSAKTIIPQTCLKCGNVVYPHTLVPVIPKVTAAK